LVFEFAADENAVGSEPVAFFLISLSIAGLLSGNPAAHPGTTFSRIGDLATNAPEPYLHQGRDYDDPAIERSQPGPLKSLLSAVFDSFKHVETNSIGIQNYTSTPFAVDGAAGCVADIGFWAEMEFDLAHFCPPASRRSISAVGQRSRELTRTG
jgi:hypothetical protein